VNSSDCPKGCEPGKPVPEICDNDGDDDCDGAVDEQACHRETLDTCEYPVPNIESCPKAYRQQVETDMPAPTNACGPQNDPDLAEAIPDAWGSADFRPACNTHDECYAVCNKPRAACDEGILTDLVQACRKAYNSVWLEDELHFCYSAALIYYDFVVRNGETPYSEGQQFGCMCCRPMDG
jgi:hypothetical protein